VAPEFTRLFCQLLILLLFGVLINEVMATNCGLLLHQTVV